MRPKRTDDKYWTGTRNFTHIQYESDLEDYIIDLENETQQLRKHAVSNRYTLQDMIDAYDAGAWNPHGETAKEYMKRVYNVC